jgi:hypothetical protein
MELATRWRILILTLHCCNIFVPLGGLGPNLDVEKVDVVLAQVIPFVFATS